LGFTHIIFGFIIIHPYTQNVKPFGKLFFVFLLFMDFVGFYAHIYAFMHIFSSFS